MRIWISASLVLSLVGLTPVPAAARRVQVQDQAEVEIAPPQGGGAAARPIQIRVPPGPRVTRARLAQLTRRAGPLVRRCMHASHPDRSFDVTLVVRVMPGFLNISALEVRTNPRDVDAAAVRCIQAQVRQYVERRMGRNDAQAPVVAQVRLRIAAQVTVDPPPNPHPHPHPHPHPDPDPIQPVQPTVAQIRTQVQAVLARPSLANALLRCLDTDGRLAGRATLQIRVDPDGSLTMVGASLPPGRGNPATLGCVADVVRRARLSRGRTASVQVRHDFRLGR